MADEARRSQLGNFTYVGFGIIIQIKISQWTLDESLDHLISIATQKQDKYKTFRWSNVSLKMIEIWVSQWWNYYFIRWLSCYFIFISRKLAFFLGGIFSDVHLKWNGTLFYWHTFTRIYTYNSIQYSLNNRLSYLILSC